MHVYIQWDNCIITYKLCRIISHKLHITNSFTWILINLIWFSACQQKLNVCGIKTRNKNKDYHRRKKNGGEMPQVSWEKIFSFRFSSQFQIVFLLLGSWSKSISFSSASKDSFVKLFPCVLQFLSFSSFALSFLQRPSLNQMIPLPWILAWLR